MKILFLLSQIILYCACGYGNALFYVDSTNDESYLIKYNSSTSNSKKIFSFGKCIRVDNYLISPDEKYIVYTINAFQKCIIANLQTGDKNTINDFKPWTGDYSWQGMNTSFYAIKTDKQTAAVTLLKISTSGDILLNIPIANENRYIIFLPKRISEDKFIGLASDQLGKGIYLYSLSIDEGRWKVSYHELLDLERKPLSGGLTGFVFVNEKKAFIGIDNMQYELDCEQYLLKKYNLDRYQTFLAIGESYAFYFSNCTAQAKNYAPFNEVNNLNTNCLLKYDLKTLTSDIFVQVMEINQVTLSSDSSFLAANVFNVEKNSCSIYVFSVKNKRAISIIQGENPHNPCWLNEAPRIFY